MPLCRCILLKFYIKPQLRLERELAYCVVSYRNSTSNHNEGEPLNTQRKLYLIEILHQTTTLNFIGREFILLYLIEILHQTTTGLAAGLGSGALYLIEILHQTTTEDRRHLSRTGLYLIEILHQTTTAGSAPPRPLRCILSKFYIKPQLPVPFRGYQHVVSYRNSTSNHNSKTEEYPYPALYLIEILHQTTTLRLTICLVVGCILSKFYIKPQQDAKRQTAGNGCILSKFYIKPQRSARTALRSAVVSYRNSTSNHNGRPCMAFTIRVVSYRNSTSNHN